MKITKDQLRRIIRESVHAYGLEPELSWFDRLAAERGYAPLPIGSDFGEGGWEIDDDVYATAFGDFNPLTGEDDRIYVYQLVPGDVNDGYADTMIDDELGYVDSVEELDALLSKLS
jgi:hypothetical protein